MSSIVTFYSYKGGVGRSMALANVAVLLARRGLKVLVVDWDLEAPGLERYSSYFNTVRAGPGLLRLLMAVRDGTPADYVDFVSIIEAKAPHPITFLSSGREQDEAYSRNLEAFDWTEFFKKRGGAFLEKMRNDWREVFDLVLIDSRTGLSDAGGVCTIQLPDAVVAMFTANYQSVYGVRDVINLAQKARQTLAYDRMPLTVLPLPSRWGVQEFAETQIWLDRIVEGMQQFYSDWLPRSVNVRQVAEAIKIPHHSYFGFGERLAVEEQGVTDPTSLGFVYNKVAAFLASDFRDLTPLVGEEVARAATMETPVLAAQPAASIVREDYKYDVFVSYDRSQAEQIIELLDDLRKELNFRRAEPLRIFLDIREVSLTRDQELEILQALDCSKVMLSFVTPRYMANVVTAGELHAFVRRGGLAGKPLLLPVILSGNDDEFPGFFRTLRRFDLRTPDNTSMLKSSGGRRTSEWFRNISQIALEVIQMVDDAPPFEFWSTTMAGSDSTIRGTTMSRPSGKAVAKKLSKGSVAKKRSLKVTRAKATKKKVAGKRLRK